MKYLLVLLLSGCSWNMDLSSTREDVKRDVKNAIEHHKVISVKKGDMTEWYVERKPGQ